uniref:MARVEL domain containing 2b n=1 Tax=Sander lucioperca TaxID=283035 RepID=A0A8D0CZF5_SANLU
LSNDIGSVTRCDRVREIPHYDQVPVGSLWQDFPSPPESLHGTVPAVSLDPLPPPPLPKQPAVGPESFYPPNDSEPMEAKSDVMDIEPVHRFIPDSVKNFFRGNSGNRGSKGWAIDPPAPPLSSGNHHTTAGVPWSYRDPYGGSGGSYTSQKEQNRLLLDAEAFESASAVPTNLSALTYHERVEEYHQRYAYLKSWAGLLRILGCVQLLLGAAVFACVCAYVHKDNEWFNMYGYSQPQLFGGLGGGAVVCLKLWRHEASRMRKEMLAHELGPASRASEQTPLPTIQPDNNYAAAPLMALEPEILRGHIPAGHIPKPVVIADYVAKYPSISSEEERDQYKAVFNDQHAEYKELHAEVQAMAKKFEEMDEIMQNLPSRPSSQMEKERISSILMEYQRKKADPTYLEKRERCEYLKNKLSHIKQKIQEYNKV